MIFFVTILSYPFENSGVKINSSKLPELLVDLKLPESQIKVVVLIIIKIKGF
jgi:hypothetical protein